MQHPTLRQSLTSTSSISLSGWLITFLPASGIVALQELTTPYPSFAFVLLSATAQHIVGGLLAALALGVQRIAPRADRLVIRFILWTAIGASRGLVGGALASALAGVDPEFGPRMLFWILATWTWMPALSYVVAQVAARRELLGIRDAQLRRLAAADTWSVDHRESLRADLLAAVRASVGPAVEEIRARLRSMGGTLDVTATREIGDRIARIADDADRIVRGIVPAVVGIETNPSLSAPPRAPLSAALEFDQRRPLWGAATMAIVLSTLLIPDAVRVAGPSAALVIAVGILASVLVVTLAAGIERLVRPRSRGARLVALAARVLAAGAAGSATIFALEFAVQGPGAWPRVLVAAAGLPVLAGIAASIIPTIAGLRAANAAAIDEIEAARAERERVLAEGGSEEARTRDQVAELLHGPIQGRLSACAMALSFHAATDPPPDEERTAFITNSVLDHLDAVARDLDALNDRRQPR